jgi:hypothetical protein
VMCMTDEQYLETLNKVIELKMKSLHHYLKDNPDEVDLLLGMDYDRRAIILELDLYRQQHKKDSRRFYAKGDTNI